VPNGRGARIMTWLDEYERRARLAPGLLTLLPLLVLLVSLGFRQRPVVAGTIAFLTAAGGPVLLSQVVRHRGLALQRRLWEKWNGSPTTQSLRHSSPVGTPEQRNSWRTELERSTGLNLPTVAEEQLDATGSDARYEVAIARLIELTRNQADFPLLHAENKNYGFERNLLAMRKPGLIVAGSAALVLIAAITLGHLGRSVDRRSQRIASESGWRTLRGSPPRLRNQTREMMQVPIVKTYGIGHGDMYFIMHGSDNFTIIDCTIPDDREDEILDEVAALAAEKNLVRFISTHPDQDHLTGLCELDGRISIINFYCVKNQATKEDPTSDFLRYCELRDSNKAFHLYRDCSRKWMNRAGDGRGSSGINIRWPVTENADYQNALEIAKNAGSPNNVSIVMTYSVEGGATFMWMGDLETDFMEKIQDTVSLPHADILFAPHHGRKSGRVPDKWLSQIDPKIVVLGQ
ncbi:unnamed protein product, partial [Symbiodinium sp. KB8]